MNINVPIDYKILFDEYTATAPGTVVRTVWTVPTGQVWVMTQYAVRRSTAANGSIYVMLSDGINSVFIVGRKPTVDWEVVGSTGAIVLAPGWVIKGWFNNMTTNEIVQTICIVHRIL